MQLGSAKPKRSQARINAEWGCKWWMLKAKAINHKEWKP